MSSLREQIELRRASKPLRTVYSCYSKSPQTLCLSVYSSNETEWIFPWRLLSYGTHQVQSDREILTLMFVNKMVRIKGWNLESISDAVATTKLS